MALTAVDYQVLTALRREGLLPWRPSVIEIGEAQWYGDIPLETLSRTIDELTDGNAELRAQLHAELDAAARGDTPTWSWDLAKIFYRALLDYRKIVAIDFHGTPAALKIDLNRRVDLGSEQFELLINNGTGEHVFDVRQFFETCHQLTRPGGVMIHLMPFRGWVDHGFYSFNPTFYWDLAAANGYEVLGLIYNELEPTKVVLLPNRETIVDMARRGELGNSAMLYAVFAKGYPDSEFRTPLQAFYDGKLGPDLMQAWHKMR